MGRTAKTDKSKNTRLPITLSAKYVRDWTGPWPPIRELLQNAEDARKKGYAMDIKFTHDVDGDGVLHIITEGITMGRDALILGNSTKADDPDLAGKFGEGMKLAWMCLLREGKIVTCKVGSEIWKPAMEYFADYDSEIMVVKISPATYENKIVVKVTGLSDKDWEAIKKRVLFLSPPKQKVDTSQGVILLDDELKGKLFVKGLYVGELPDARYGYDLFTLELDRDRRVPSSYDINYKIAEIWTSLLEKKEVGVETLLDLLKNHTSIEATALSRYCVYSTGEVLAKYFEEKYNNEKLILVDSVPDQQEALHYGLFPIMVDTNVKEIYNHSRPTLKSVVKSMNKKVKNIIDIQDLTEQELEVWNSCYAKVKHLIRHDEDNKSFEIKVRIVEFYSKTLGGLFGHDSSGNLQISISRNALKSRQTTIKFLVHEIAHQYGEDGSFNHFDKICDIFAEITFN